MMKTPLVDILNQILTMDSSDINKIVEAVKMRRDQLHFKSTQNFKAGDRVEFTSSRSGRVITGSVIKVKIKYILVHSDNNQRWNIPGGMLRPIQQKVMA
jgi:lactam utilization protein B